MPFKIRLAKEDDIQYLEQLFREFSEWNLQRNESIREAINDPNGEFLVAERGGKLIALLHQVFYIDPLHAGICSTITNLFVKEQNRREGIASQLLQEALESARRRDVVEVHVTTREENDTAIRLYTKHNFKREGILLEANP